MKVQPLMKITAANLGLLALAITFAPSGLAKSESEMASATEVSSGKSGSESEDKESSKESEAKSTSKASPVQSAARPFGLDIADKVQLAASDEASAVFQKTVLPDLLKISNLRLSEAKAASNLSAISIDPSRLTLKQDTNLRVYFVAEGAGYRNSLAYSSDGGKFGKSNSELIFPDASSNAGYGGNGESVRTSAGPLSTGDFVDLGKFAAGTKLDFFLLADGANGGKNVFSTNQSENRDGLVHSVSLAPDGSAYLLIGFEDLYGGGDKDYNDVVFAVELGKANVAGLTAPEPSLALGSIFALGAFLGTHRRRNKR